MTTKRTLIHPRKAIWAMRDFINEIHDLTYEITYIPAGSQPEDDSHEAWMEWFENAWITEEGRCECKLFKSTKHGFCAINAEDEREPVFEIGYNFDQLNDMVLARKSFTDKSPMTKGFANITLALLHELGHFSSQQAFEGYDRNEEVAFLKMLPAEFAREMYFLLPDELSATNWAIGWLSHPENRKIAKRFEKKFFACFEKK
jgi:hypothetical protein